MTWTSSCCGPATPLVSSPTSWPIHTRLQPLPSLTRLVPTWDHATGSQVWSFLRPGIPKTGFSYSCRFSTQHLFLLKGLPWQAPRCTASTFPTQPCPLLTHLFYFWNLSYLKLSCWFIYLFIIHLHPLSHTRKRRIVVCLVNCRKPD